MAKASTKSSGLVVVTGFKQIDDKLRNLPNAMQKKFVRGALRRGAKKVVKDYQRIVKDEAYDTGVLYRSAKVKALKRSRTRIGVAMFQDRDKLFAAYAAKHDGKMPNPAKGESEPFYYAASIEFGYTRKDGTVVPAIKPMRRALYDNEKALRAWFEGDIAASLNSIKSTT